MLTVRQLVAEPSLRLNVVGGAAGLDRPVRAAHVSELLEPGPWLHGGDVLMTLGLLQPTELDGARRYARHCLDNAVAAVIVGLGPAMPFQVAPAPLARAGDLEGLPVIEVPDGVPFIAITEWTLNWLAAQERRLLRQVASAGRNLTGATVTPTPLPDLLHSWYAATAESAVVLDLSGAVLAEAGPGSAGLAALGPRIARDLTGDHRPQISDRPIPPGPHTPGANPHLLGTRQPHGVLLIEQAPDSTRTTDAQRRALLLPVLTALLSLHLEHQFAADRPARIQRAHVVAQLVRPGLAELQAHRLAARVGLGDGPARVVVVRPRPGEDLDALAVRLTAALPGAAARPWSAGIELVVPAPTEPTAADPPADAVPDAVPDATPGTVPDATPGTVPDAAPGAAEGDLGDAPVGSRGPGTVRSIAETLARTVGDRPTGIGALVALHELSSSCRQAHALVDVSRQTGRPAQLGHNRASALLLQLSGADLLTAVSAAVLAPLDCLPEAERLDLIDTLQTWLSANGVWETAAGRLGVHRNTVRNRIAKVSALTGRSLDDGDERYELWLALRARAAALQLRD